MGSRDILNQHADRIYKAISDIVYNDEGLENIMDTHGIEYDLTIDKYAEGREIFFRIWNEDLS